MPLDELELCIQLLQIYNPGLKEATYKELKEAIELEFKQKVELEDVYLLYEPSIEEMILDAQIYYGSMFNYTRGIY